MFTVSQALCALFLTVLSVLDIRYRQVPLMLLIAGGCFALICRGIQGDMDIRIAAGGMLVGVVFLVISKVTGEAFGYGDSILITVLGLYLGIWEVLELLFLAFMMAAVFSILGLCLHRFSRKLSFPFMPFLALAYLGVLVL